MRIEDVARLAGVSISTVSKIVNGKDQNINPKTRERVLKIVKEYNYTPYGSVLQNGSAKTFLLGFLSDSFAGRGAVNSGLLMAGQQQNYSLVVCNSFGSAEEELKNISRLVRSRVDAVLWRPLTEESRAHKAHFDRAGIPVFFMAAPGGGQPEDLKLDFEQLAYQATQLLVEKGHAAIGCVASVAGPAEGLAFRGYQRCLFDHHIVPPQQEGVQLPEPALFLSGFTGFVCLDDAAASQVWRLAAARNLRVPEDLSLVALSEDDARLADIPGLSRLLVPWRRFGRYVAAKMVAAIEQTGEEPQFDLKAALAGEGSLAAPVTQRVGRVVVVGSLNMDVTINTETPLNTGVTTIAAGWNTAPGGKGLNQALGAARMGGRASLIGKVGKDYDGATLFSLLADDKVDTSGVSSVENVATGKAYIAVQQDGESSIAVYAGANACLSPADIDANAALLDDAAYCLLPMEVPRDTVYRMARLARQRGAKLIVKPTNTDFVSDELLAMVDIFVPNRKEALALCGPDIPVERQAELFLEKGVKAVIITLGHQGCYLRTAEVEKRVPPIKVKPLDTTGGADAFIAALATLLAENEPLEQAVERANYAAGLSVMRLGVTQALPDRVTMELYYSRGMYL